MGHGALQVANGAESAPCDLCIVWGMLNAVIGPSARGAVPGDCPRKGAAMEFTSASANKYLRRLQDEKSFILGIEAECSTYVLGDKEVADPPAYSYEETRAKVAEIDRTTMVVRHAVHQFNMATVLSQCGLTIGEVLIALA